MSSLPKKNLVINLTLKEEDENEETDDKEEEAEILIIEVPRVKMRETLLATGNLLPISSSSGARKMPILGFNNGKLASDIVSKNEEKTNKIMNGSEKENGVKVDFHIEDNTTANSNNNISSTNRNNNSGRNNSSSSSSSSGSNRSNKDNNMFKQVTKERVTLEDDDDIRDTDDKKETEMVKNDIQNSNRGNISNSSSNNGNNSSSSSSNSNNDMNNYKTDQVSVSISKITSPTGIRNPLPETEDEVQCDLLK